MKTSCDALERFLKKELSLHGSKDFPIELSLEVCGKKKIKSLNRDYRSKDKATDVLSFQIHEDLREGEAQIFGPLELGDIYICSEVAHTQAKKFGISFEEELIHLFIHGFLHLVGFDHELSEKEEKVMFAHEQALVESILKKYYR